MAETERNKKWRLANREKLLARQRARYLENKERLKPRHRETHLKRKYGLTLESFDALYTSQGGKCAICLSELNPFHNHTCVDHDHATGAVRGILCHGCNTGLGYFRDDVQRLLSAAEYIKARRMI